MNSNNSFSAPDYPGLYQTADMAAVKAQNGYLRMITLYQYLLIAAVICSLIMGTSTVLAILSAIILLATLSVSIFLAFKRYDKIWYNGRAVAESVKTVTWRYMMGAEPYNSSDVSVAKSKFIMDLQQIFEQNKQLEQIFSEDTATTEAISERMANIRALPLNERKSIYLTDRIDDQRIWYRKKANFNKKKGLLWFILMCVAQTGALICVIIRIAKPKWNYLPIDICIVCAAAALTWIQTKRFQDLSTAYSLTAHEISLLREYRQNISNEKDFSDFVNDAENAFSREHTQWQARRHT